MFFRAAHDLRDELMCMGYSEGELGTHSCRKGVATMVACGCTVSPPIASLCIRAGWVMGGVKDKYIFREGSGDQYVGRCESCLDQLTKEFSTSPPYFDFTSLSIGDGVKMRKAFKSFVESRLPSVSYPANSLHLLFTLFSSICYHYDHLKEQLPQECPLYSSPLFLDVPPEIRSLAVVKFPWNKTSDTPKFTGIPPHVLILSDMEKLKVKVVDLEKTIVSDLKDAMDERGFTTAAYNHKMLVEQITEKNKELFTDMITQTGMTLRKQQDDLDKMNDPNLYVCMEDEDGNFDVNNPTDIDELTTAEKQELNRIENEARLKTMNNRKFFMGFHHGNLNPLPPDFKWPPMTMQQLIIRWFVSNIEENVPPFSSLHARFLNHDRNLLSGWNCMKTLMRYVQTCAEAQKFWISNMSEWTYKICGRKLGKNTLWIPS